MVSSVEEKILRVKPKEGLKPLGIKKEAGECVMQRWLWVPQGSLLIVLCAVWLPGEKKKKRKEKRTLMGGIPGNGK